VASRKPRGCRRVGLPEFNEAGDLPEGMHSATLAEVVARFGVGSARRQEVTDRLVRIHELALRTGELDRLVIFGSYVSDTAEPNDVDVVLVMHDGFHPDQCPPESAALFDHARATAELGASVFWIRPGMLLGESLDDFLAHWQIKRDGRRRGLVEVKS
jgi:hypothetical protein